MSYPIQIWIEDQMVEELPMRLATFRILSDWQFNQPFIGSFVSDTIRHDMFFSRRSFSDYFTRLSTHPFVGW